MGYNGEPHAFEGWRFIEYPLAGYGSPWRSESGGGAMAFPLKLTGLIVEQYGQVVYMNQLRSPNEPAWRIGDILCE
jgi:hypothetical protein